jgi:CheY-like chemotaxis protein
VRFTVTDTGPGIPAEQQCRLFQSFSQLGDPDVKRFRGGSGLGLAICKQIAEALGGAMEVRSVSNEGSSFIFTLPLPEEEEPASLQPPRGDAETLDSLPAMRILLAEDDRLHQIYLSEFIRKAGHELEIASSGAEALRALQHRHFDLILMDIQMPEMDGLEATARIRKGQSCADPNIPVIALTAHGMREQLETFLKEGMNGHVVKPVDLTQLARLMGEFCTRPSAEA